MNLWPWYRKYALKPAAIGWLLIEGYAFADFILHRGGRGAQVYEFATNSLFASLIFVALLALCLTLHLNAWRSVRSNVLLSGLAWMGLPLAAMAWFCSTELYAVVAEPRYRWWQALPSFLISVPLAIGLLKGWKEFKRSQIGVIQNK